MTKLCDIQKALKAPKGQYNKFGGYAYRSCEDILEAVKPLLGDASLVIYDEIVLVGDRYYVKATADLQCEEGRYQVSGYAREPEDRKGMDPSQVTGSASSYARKYALNGLFCIDDTKDPDATNDHGKGAKKAVNPQGAAPAADETQTAKSRLMAAIKNYCAVMGADEKAVKGGIAKRPDYAPNAEFYNNAAAEFEAAVANR